MKTGFQKILTLAACLALTLLARPIPASAHGVAWEMSAKKAYGLEFSYDDETPMAYAEIKVFGPDDPTALSQTGRADKNGGFAFLPDRPGQWLVTADDGAGHLAKAEVAIAAPSDGAAQEAAPAPAVNTERETEKAVKPYKIAMVISLFLNVALAASMVSRRKKA